ncbi:GntR family transcriptional regulator [Asticcacaulis sp. EMRT-3]|uniref:GntR family transcriptional regulator n=1 Tax=Asticcacaulis sp. EMRT-3 TaxID=3040349 RepID=UPI0024AF4524|nr:GntR family transcriptional regulator [Asticcacaulis sp. EMRT-3]MDI7773985.1 GntR family transcriptional regulator [Asticcacaulis sp. EMRT-3]
MVVARLEASAGGIGAEARIHDQVYDRLAEALIQGQIPPGKSVSLRGLAENLGVSPMPVREAVRRLIAERALEVQPSNKRLRVPDLSEHRLMQLAKARQWVEPELAFLATAHATKDTTRRLRDDDAAVMAALAKGDVSAYMQSNQDFHFSIYRLAGAELFFDMARTLWLQAGPFMRVVFGRMGTVHLPRDHHQDMIAALERGDAEAVRVSMAADIHEGMDLMMEAIKAQAEPEPKRRKRPSK